MTSQIVRIALRYLAMFLAARGFFSAEDGNMLADDPDLAALIEMAIGAAIGIGTEVWWWAAEKWKARNTVTIKVRDFEGENV